VSYEKKVDDYFFPELLVVGDISRELLKNCTHIACSILNGTFLKGTY
jgi:hypothetical protein